MLRYDGVEALPMLKHWKRFGVTNETIGNGQLAFAWLRA